MDLGGDSSRLYFYDPLRYLNSLPLYGITPDGVGTVVTGYFLLPLVILLLFLKNILGSSSLLITLFNSFSLIVSFISVYLIVLTFLEEFKKEKFDKSLAGSLAGLFYVFSPILTMIGWEKALTVHNQVFLNPLLFLFFLKYIHSKKIAYLLISFLVSFIFAPNFSPSPYLLAFFPLAISFLLIYALKIKKIKLNLKDILLSIALFVGIHLFHLLPMFLNLFSQDSAVFNSAFSDQGKFIRGLSYFTSVAESIKLTTNIFSLPQGAIAFAGINFLWIFPPLIVLIGLIMNRQKKTSFTVNKTFLLISLFFLISLFLATAKITNIGFTFYKVLFNIPGFAMFRNYWGQFSHVFIFFYTLLLGLAVFYILISLKDIKKKAFVFLCIAFLIIANSWSFIKGDTINSVLNSGSPNEVRIPITMDPDYEKLLDIIRTDQVDAKYVTLPLTDTAYQIIGGKTGGAYMGPSTIAYLGGKKDFSGHADFFPYHDAFFNLVEKKDYQSIKKLFSILNIKYIVYNSDQSLYDNFPDYPYDYVREYFPTLKSYEDFLLKLDLKEKFHVGKYYLYTVHEENFLPHFYIPKNTSSYPNLIEDWESVSPFYSFSNNRIAIDSSSINSKDNQILLEADKVDIYKRINKDFPLPVYYPFAKYELNSKIYPLIVFRENSSLNSFKNTEDTYIDRTLFYNAKRISELSKGGGKIPVLGNLNKLDELMRHYKKPQGIMDYVKSNNYNSWESVLSRYTQQLEEVTFLVKNSKNNLAWKQEKKSIIVESIKNNKISLNIVIKNSDMSSRKKQYLFGLVDDLFDNYTRKNQSKEYSPSQLEYSFSQAGSYDVYVQNDGLDLTNSKLISEDNTYSSSPSDVDSSQTKFDNVTLDRPDNFLSLSIPSNNISEDDLWEETNNIAISNATDSATINSIKPAKDNIEGLVKHITNFDDDSVYLLSFDYLTHGNNFEFILWTKEKISKKNKKSGLYEAKFHENKNTREWTTFNIVLSTKDLTDAAISVYSKDNTEIDIKDFSVAKLPPQPGVIAKKVRAEEQIVNVPKISFEKINPTKYKVKVTDAKHPYTLVFLDAFDRNWKLYINSENSDVKKIVASYFNGDINQNVSKNIFLDKSTFETWNKKPISDNNHFIVNGYANGWNINPDSVENKTSYELIIELQNQKIFYISLGISLLSVLICVILIMKKYNEK